MWGRFLVASARPHHSIFTAWCHSRLIPYFVKFDLNLGLFNPQFYRSLFVAAYLVLVGGRYSCLGRTIVTHGRNLALSLQAVVHLIKTGLLAHLQNPHDPVPFECSSSPDEDSRRKFPHFYGALP